MTSVLEIEGPDLSNVHGVGSRMTAGAIRVQGPIGRHLGAQMSGGAIVVDGDAGDWAGAEMRGGLIHIQGQSGHTLGRRLSWQLARNDRWDNPGRLPGRQRNRPRHATRADRSGGDAGDATGFGLLAGTIVVGGSLGLRTGSQHAPGHDRATWLRPADDSANVRDLLPATAYVLATVRRALATTWICFVRRGPAIASSSCSRATCWRVAGETCWLPHPSASSYR